MRAPRAPVLAPNRPPTRRMVRSLPAPPRARRSGRSELPATTGTRSVTWAEGSTPASVDAAMLRASLHLAHVQSATPRQPGDGARAIYAMSPGEYATIDEAS